MKESLQLRIPTPCAGDWTRMQPAEKGRHCQTCCKTVVDFTEMSDAEIIRLLSQAGPHVCGRLMPDQLNRTLAPAPVQKNGRSGWTWVLASLLMVAKGPDTARPVKTGKIEVREPKTDADSTFVRTVTMGKIRPRGEEVDSPIREEGASGVIRGRQAKRVLEDTALMGDTIMVVRADSVRPPADTVSPATRRSNELSGVLGGAVAVVKVTRVTDILVDTVKQLVSDTLTALGWRPAPDLNVYPNPVSRGGAIQLAWKTQPGQYQLTLINTRGQLIAERILDVGGAGQVDSWEIPASLAAGIYILRVVRQGGAGAAGSAGSATAAGPAAVCTREIMVR